MRIRYCHAEAFQLYKAILISNRTLKEGGNTNTGMLVIKKLPNGTEIRMMCPVRRTAHQYLAPFDV
jgi:hypothetical protein